MSELKVYHHELRHNEYEEFYLKYEADKEIEFWKKESHDHYERWFSLNKQYEGWFGKVMRCERAERELRHQKYKRCLAMAKYCKSEQTYSSFAIYITEHPESRWANKSVGAGNWIAFWKNREQRWLELAEKFKTN